MKKIYFLIIFVFLSFFSFAKESIIYFFSDIELQKDGSIIVTEKIKVKADRKLIKRGIYRDLPREYKNKHGKKQNLEIKVLKVTRNGKKEKFSTKTYFDYTRISIGSLKHIGKGIFEYEIKYKTNSQAFFKKEYDEIYWNVTGDEWKFDIEKAEAQFRIAGINDKIENYILSYEGYSGKLDENISKNVKSYINEEGYLKFDCTEKLFKNQGLAINISLKKDFIKKNTFDFFDIYLFLTLIGFVIVYYYYEKIYMKYGEKKIKNKFKNNIISPINPSMSVLEFGYIYEKCYSYKFTNYLGTIINIAIKGHILIKRNKTSFWFYKKESNQTLAENEEKILKDLFKTDEEKIEISLKNMDKFYENKKISTDFYNYNYNELHISNTKFFLRALSMSFVFFFFPYFLKYNISDGTIMALVFYFFLYITGMVIDNLIYDFKETIKKYLPLIIICLCAQIYFIPLFSIIYLSIMSFYFTIVYILFLVLNIKYGRMIENKTEQGKKIIDEMEQYKKYIQNVEQTLKEDNKENIKIYEENLPYVIILEEEKKWNLKFYKILEKYTPNWLEVEDENIENILQLEKWLENLKIELSNVVDIAYANKRRSMRSGRSSGGGRSRSSGGSRGGGGGR